MIGIISAPNNKMNTDCAQSYLYASYIHWVEMAGENCIIIPYNIHEKELDTILKRVNGLLWVGGEIPNKRYHTQQQEDDLINTLFYCYTYAICENDKGNYYPIWGTCLGMDILIMFSKNEATTIRSSIQRFPLNGNYPFKFTENSSKLKKIFPIKLQEIMKYHKCVKHHHTFGNSTIPDTIKIVSMQYNFINCIEFIQYPFYGVQFHPEQPETDLAIKVSQILIDFFASECKKNKNVWKWKLSDFKKQKLLL